MGEGLDESLRQRLETLSEKLSEGLKVAVRWYVYDVVRSLSFSRGDVGWGLMTE